jgi:hypothetical protein
MLKPYINDQTFWNSSEMWMVITGTSSIDFLKRFNWFVSSRENTQNASVKYHGYVNMSRLLYTTIFSNMLYFNKQIYCTVLYCTVLYCNVLYCTVLYCTVLYCTVLYCTVLYCTVLYCLYNRLQQYYADLFFTVNNIEQYYSSWMGCNNAEQYC